MKQFSGKLLLIGSNPSSTAPDTSPFHPQTKSRQILDQWFQDLGCHISYANVVDAPTPNNRPLRVSEIREAIPSLHNKTQGYDKVIALGSAASKALDMAGISHFKAPHPSGRNRQLNDLEWVRRKVLELTDYVLS